MAEEWIECQQGEYAAGRHVTFAMTLAVNDRVISSIGLEIQHEHHHARLSH
jgi:RimJ/RimL family protein N-acetyltransferase